MKTVEALIALWEDMKRLRMPLEKHYQECADFSIPVRGAGFNSSTAATPEEQQDQISQAQARLYDSTSTEAINILASSLVSGLTPANSRWFSLDDGDDSDNDSEVADYLDTMSERVFKAIHASNFDGPGFESMLDLGCFGFTALYIEETDDGPVFESWPLARCWIGESKKGSGIDIIARHFLLTASQAVSEYGEEMLCDKIKELAKENKAERFPFLQIIAPRDMIDPVNAQGKRSAKDKMQPFASAHIDLTGKKVCRASGYHEFPVAAPRWIRLPDSPYAIGPMSNALPDVKTLNRGEEITLDNAEIQSYGMYGIKNDGVLNAKTFKIGARRVVVAESKDSLWSIAPPGNPNIMQAQQEQRRSQLRRILFADQLQPLQGGPAKTATEVHYRINLIRQLIGPMYGRMQSEHLQRIVFRVLGMEMRRDLARGIRPPDALRGRELNLRYLSPLARAQQLEEVAGIERFEAGLMTKAQGLQDSSTLDIYDFEAADRRKADALGVPRNLLRSEADIKKIRKGRAEAEAKAAAAAQPSPATAPASAASAPLDPAQMLTGAPSPAALGMGEVPNVV